VKPVRPPFGTGRARVTPTGSGKAGKVEFIAVLEHGPEIPGRHSTSVHWGWTKACGCTRGNRQVQAGWPEPPRQVHTTPGTLFRGESGQQGVASCSVRWAIGGPWRTIRWAERLHAFVKGSGNEMLIRSNGTRNRWAKTGQAGDPFANGRMKEVCSPTYGNCYKDKQARNGKSRSQSLALGGRWLCQRSFRARPPRLAEPVPPRGTNRGMS